MSTKICTNLTVIILTYNESIHIERAIKNVSNWSKDIFVLDSGSNDDTVIIAESLGAKVFTRKFDNYAKQRTYAIKELPITSDWVLFLDADEYLTEELKVEIADTLEHTDKDGFYLKRRFIFMNKWIKYGGYYPTWILRLFKKDLATIDREMNEHIVVSGKVGYLKKDFTDHNLKGLKSWIQKHKKYAEFEAIELINKRRVDPLADIFGNQTQRKRWIRYYIWNNIPPFIRPIVFFVYKIIFMLGILDGPRGWLYHFMHGFWYKLLIDIKYLRMKYVRNSRL